MNNKPRNHPLEEILEIEEGSTPRIDNPFLAAEQENNLFNDEDTKDLEVDADEFYDVDTSIDDVMTKAPVVEDFYDDIDKKTEQKFQEIYNFGLQAFSTQLQEARLVDGKYRARNLEVAAQYLRIALDSAKDAGNQKANKDKIKVAEKKVTQDANKTTNNIIVDHSTLLKALAQAEKVNNTKVIDQDS